MIDTLLTHSKARWHYASDPFPHLIVRDPYDCETAEKLLHQFPSQETIAHGRALGSNNRFSYSSSRVIADNTIGELWQSVIRAHISQTFLNQVVDIFRDDIKKMYPNIEEQNGTTDSWQAVQRGKETNKGEISLDAQICINTPVTGRATSVRGPHVDTNRKLIAGLYYLRSKDDTTPGGNLLLYRWKDGVQPQFFRKQYAPPHLVEVVGEVPYSNNVLVMFVNSIKSLHGVTPRGSGTYPRLFMNLVGEVPFDLYAYENYRETLWNRIIRRVNRDKNR